MTSLLLTGKIPRVPVLFDSSGAERLHPYDIKPFSLKVQEGYRYKMVWLSPLQVISRSDGALLTYQIFRLL